MLDFLKNVHDVSLEEAKSFSFDKQHPWHRNMVALYGSLIEFSGALINCFNNNTIIAVEQILRAFLEASVEFTNLSKNKTYGYHMEASYHEQWIKVLKEAKTKENPYLNMIGEHEISEQSLTYHENELNKLESKKYHPLNIFEKFRMAGMKHEYRSIYNFLSNESHSNIRSLISRHFEIDPTTENFNVVFYKNWQVEDYEHYITDTSFHLLKAGEKLHELLETNRQNVFTELLNNLEEKHKNA